MAIYFLGWTAQYEQRFVSYLAERYDVGRTPDRKGLVRLHRIVKKILGARCAGLLGRLYCKLAGFSGSDMLICNEGQIHRKLNPAILEAFPGIRILVVRDLVDSAFLTRWRSHFDAIYSFDQVQCARLGMQVMNQFLPIGYDEKRMVPVCADGSPTALFIGRDKHRSRSLLALAELLKACDYEVDFRILVDDSTQERSAYHITSLVSYAQSLASTLSAHVLVEMNQPGQAGFTLRPLEAAYFSKKLITTNPAILQSSLYHPNNVYVLDGPETWDAERLRAFLESDFYPLSKETIFEYSPDYMLEFLISRHGAAVREPAPRS